MSYHIYELLFEDVNTHILGTSFRDVWPLGFLWPSGNLSVHCHPQEIRGNDPRRLVGWEPWWALDEKNVEEASTHYLKAEKREQYVMKKIN